jgi:hypothetical protein
LRALKLGELAAWIKTHKLSGKRRTKDGKLLVCSYDSADTSIEAIHAIQNAPVSKQLTKDDIKRIINEVSKIV